MNNKIKVSYFCQKIFISCESPNIPNIERNTRLILISLQRVLNARKQLTNYIDFLKQQDISNSFHHV